jgi:hypothetical protein
MSNEVTCANFFVIQDKPGDVAEVWLDWEPAIDGEPGLDLKAWRDGEDLLIQAQGDSSVRPVRRFAGLNLETWDGLTKGGVLVICGPSGVLSKRVIRVESAGNA